MGNLSHKSEPRGLYAILYKPEHIFFVRRIQPVVDHKNKDKQVDLERCSYDVTVLDPSRAIAQAADPIISVCQCEPPFSSKEGNCQVSQDCCLTSENASTTRMSSGDSTSQLFTTCLSSCHQLKTQCLTECANQRTGAGTCPDTCARERTKQTTIGQSTEQS